MVVRAVIFDKDGTFVDFMATWGPAIECAMRDLAGDDEATLARLADVNLYDLERRTLAPGSPFIAEASIDFARRWADALRIPFCDAFHRRMDELFDAGALAHVTALGAPAPVFARLRAGGMCLGVVTNDTERGARAQCERLGLTSYFDAIIGYDSGHGRKPAPGPVLAFAEQMGLRPTELALVGDSRHDLVAARAAGAMAIGVLTGFATRDELAPLADHVIDDIAALPGLLDL